jgi:hypothetical protein
MGSSVKKGNKKVRDPLPPFRPAPFCYTNVSPEGLVYRGRPLAPLLFVIALGQAPGEQTLVYNEIKPLEIETGIDLKGGAR